ncbi:MAG: omptin family outer membrane protease [Thermodesulfobacteriota bacterium]
MCGLGWSVAGAQAPVWAPMTVPYSPCVQQHCQYERPYEVALGIRKCINSFTSYQFPNPFPPNQDPLSRLEFPIDQWFGGLRGEYSRGCVSVFAEGWINLNSEANLKMQDSDWDDESNPFQKTIFSESQCALNRGYLVDMGLSFGKSSGTMSLRPVGGYRYQYFDFTTHDGNQMDMSGNVSPLPGDGIRFRQTFNHAYLGGIWKASLGQSRGSACATKIPSCGFACGSKIEFSVQADIAWAQGWNEDKHLLRAGDRRTVERTKGYCWHIGLSTSMHLSDAFLVRLEGDFKRLTTTGSHNLTNDAFGIDFSFDGAKVWSDQGSIAAMAQMRF